ncbi:hypothetical protein D3C81_1083150 [compost metagenome]
MPAALLAHNGQYRASQINHPVKAGIHQLLEILGACFFEGANIAIACIVYQDIKPSEGVQRKPNRRLCRFLIGHI